MQKIISEIEQIIDNEFVRAWGSHTSAHNAAMLISNNAAKTIIKHLIDANITTEEKLNKYNGYDLLEKQNN
jgi:hypothetical protein